MIVIPDIHGRTFWKQAIENRENDQIIFLGDYLDPYEYEGISKQDAIDNFKEIIEFKKNHKNNVILLLGNHDLHYLCNADKCRIDYLNRPLIKKLFEDNADLFQIGYYTEKDGNYTFTHSAITTEWANNPRNVEMLGVDTNDICEIIDRLNAFWMEPSDHETLFNLLMQIGRSRGGWSRYGSPIWADVSEVDIFHQDFKGYFQVFGHSQQTKNSYDSPYWICLDCRRAFELIDGEFIPITPEDSMEKYFNDYDFYNL